MTVARIDVHDHNDTELGAMVRDAFALGKTMVLLIDSGQPERRAATWPDGLHGLYRMECENDHVWLTKLAGSMIRRPKRSTCNICGCDGEWMDCDRWTD